MTDYDEVWRSLERTVAEGYAPGMVAGIRHRGRTGIFATGRHSFAADAAPMHDDTPFRVASLGKLVAGAISTQLLAEGVFALDDPAARWLPEFAEPRVLPHPDAPLDAAVRAERDITVRHLLTMTAGFASPFADTPLLRAMAEAAVGTGPVPAQVTSDEFAARLGALPLEQQPGTVFAYDTAADVLSILLARATGGSLGDLVRTRISEPLGLTNTAFHPRPGPEAGTAGPVTASRPAESPSQDPLPTPYRLGDAGTLEVAHDLVAAFAHPPLFESLRGGLVSTVPDFLRFLAAVADDELLTFEQRAAMTTDHLTDAQRAGLDDLGGPGYGWGWQTGVDLLPEPGASVDAPAFRAIALAAEPWRSPGRWGWAGGTGTSAYVDPARDLIGVVFTQHELGAPTDDFGFFWGPVTGLRD